MVNDNENYDFAELDNELVTESIVRRSSMSELSEYFERDARRYDRGFYDA